MKAFDYFSTFPFAELSSQDGMSRLRFCTYAYEYPDETPGDDADWHRNFFALALPGFRVELNETIMQGQELVYLLKELEEFSELKKQEVRFEPIEPYFKLKLTFTPIKNVQATGSVQYPVGYGSTLEFEFETDLTYVDQFIKGIRAILEQFPSRQS